MTIKASTVYGSSSGGVRPNGLQGFRFGPSGVLLPGLGAAVVSGVNISTGLVTCLTLSGKFAVGQLFIDGIAIGANNLRIVLEIDGVTVIDSTEAGSILANVGIINSNLPIVCQSSLVLRAQKPTATAVNINYQAISLL